MGHKAPGSCGAGGDKRTRSRTESLGCLTVSIKQRVLYWLVVIWLLAMPSAYS